MRQRTHRPDAAVTFDMRVSHTGRAGLPGDVAIVHIIRDADGTRRVSDVIRSRPTKGR